MTEQLKKKFVDNLDKYMKMFLDRDVKICEELNKQSATNDKKAWEFNFNALYQERIAYSYLMRFANETIGRVEVNKLCRKYGVSNEQ